MECFALSLRQKITNGYKYCYFKHSLKSRRRLWRPSRSLYVRQYVSSPISNHPNNTTQHIPVVSPVGQPLSGYYLEVLSSRLSSRGQPTSFSLTGNPPAINVTQDEASPAVKVEPQSPQDKMSIVFGSRLASPGYQSTRYHPDTMQPVSTWKTINGVAIPPRPEEPENCCMSGCVHCVWDDYRDDVEQWAARLEQAKAMAKGTPKDPIADMRQTPRPEVQSAVTSMDDDGGGSETNWAPTSRPDELFSEIPVGIREFMKTEKKLRQRHQEEQTVV
ncbi:hypothetical protein ASPZODRAFT_132440 [Penicilliopsis zonata CBS 506.65]|uniref:Oxidoreductase-like domain-containing protein n=1 Tax=Penicilliopsis zonata CBS 506.65 TaxID=1073090 RepID=A0A1L9SGQ2_9EURO|nr:hypothetical protein ASPZODRAFT_132440 [Penicilliopsis zonata CBS 506.65]OJJ46359.1 hypothetical protein ASPZODRAFT_132440 [Penicilliopsis zonata CBS 506.65]